MAGITKLCRLCLSQEGNCNLFDVDGLSVDIQRHLGIQIEPIEEMPKLICHKCLDLINKIKELRMLALHNQYRLKDMHSKLSKKCYSVQEENDLASDEDDFITLNSTSINPHALKNDIKSVVAHIAADVKHRVSCEASPTMYSTSLAVRKDLYPSNHPHSKSEVVLKTAVKERAPNSRSELLVNRSHQMNREDLEAATWQCPKCKKLFDKRKKFYHHQRMHSKTFECPINACGKLFATKGDLEKHIRVHTGEKPYECSICYKRFTQRCTLKSHMENLHAKELGYSFSCREMPVKVEDSAN